MEKECANCKKVFKVKDKRSTINCSKKCSNEWIYNRIKKPRRCSECQRMLRGWNKSLLCTYHSMLSHQAKKNLIARRERNEIIN